MKLLIYFGTIFSVKMRIFRNEDGIQDLVRLDTPKGPVLRLIAPGSIKGRYSDTWDFKENVFSKFDSFGRHICKNNNGDTADLCLDDNSEMLLSEDMVEGAKQILNEEGECLTKMERDPETGGYTLFFRTCDKNNNRQKWYFAPLDLNTVNENLNPVDKILTREHTASNLIPLETKRNFFESLINEINNKSNDLDPEMDESMNSSNTDTTNNEDCESKVPTKSPKFGFPPEKPSEEPSPKPKDEDISKKPSKVEPPKPSPPLTTPKPTPPPVSTPAKAPPAPPRSSSITKPTARPSVTQFSLKPNTKVPKQSPASAHKNIQRPPLSGPKGTNILKQPPAPAIKRNGVTVVFNSAKPPVSK
ncbi:hypothetical protein NGRA_1669 [Nosema granulosis]|uniref:Uncharacterized protein n=1 Tax=Nosema granulosis TaxID=83296 RepID=A0A9P6KYX6_9MICR|nr:hypothetical protein NGRA_1669 [Nosema granulosis]